ncbi:MAG: nucleotidyltransferase domain-containing protein [Candidatus Omnitrophota bacterium]
MKINDPLNKILDNEVKVKILRFFIKTTGQWNGRQIAKEVGVAPATAHKALQGLYKEGALILRNVGKTHLYNLKEDTYLVSDLLRPLFTKEDKVLNNIVETIKDKIGASTNTKKDIVSVSLFGSVSLAKERSTSDIDLAVIIRNAKRRQKVESLFEEIDKEISSKFGNTVSPYINTEAEFRAKCKKKLAVIRNILLNNKRIYGKEAKEIL